MKHSQLCFGHFYLGALSFQTKYQTLSAFFQVPEKMLESLMQAPSTAWLSHSPAVPSPG